MRVWAGFIGSTLTIEFEDGKRLKNIEINALKYLFFEFLLRSFLFCSLKIASCWRARQPASDEIA